MSYKLRKEKECDIIGKSCKNMNTFLTKLEEEKCGQEKELPRKSQEKE